MTEKGSELTIKLRERPLPSRLRYLAELLDHQGGDEVIRFAIGTVLIAIATELELHPDDTAALMAEVEANDKRLFEALDRTAHIDGRADA